MTRVLVVGAHPDDPELMSGGLLLKHKEQGDEISIAYLTDGRYGGAKDALCNLPRVRYTESKASCQYLGAQMYWGGLEDNFLMDSVSARKICTEIIRRAKPDLLITHSAQDYHSDHLACHQIVLASNMLAATARYKSKSPPLPHLCPIWLMDTLGFPNPQATIIIDIHEVIAKKMEALSKHMSQLEWMSSQGIDLPGLIWKQAALRGEQCNVPLAEAFQQLLGWGMQYSAPLFSCIRRN